MDTQDNFEEKIRELIETLRKIEDRKFAETGTRQYFIDPFIDALGYNSNNPDQVIVENVGSDDDDDKSRVDYTIMLEGKESIIIEAKAITKNLNEKFRSQLSDYFYKYEDAQIAILTNGKHVEFYSHLKKPREHSLKMDKEPFFKFNLQDIKATDIEALKFFRRENFSPEKAIEAAIVLKYSKEVKEYLENQLNNPDENFISFITGENNSIEQIIVNKEKKNKKKQLIEDAMKFATREITGKKMINENTRQSTNKPYFKKLEVKHKNETQDDDFSVMHPNARKYIERSPTKEIYEKYRIAIKNLGNDINYRLKRRYVVFHINNKVVVSIVPKANSIRIALNIKNIANIVDIRNMCKSRNGVTLYGKGEVDVEAKEMKDFDYIMGLVKQVYDQKA